ncbi:MAG TPA: TIGR00730 family Rossman fold protein [Dehalococcoidia bacterium]|nr:TIGR00730 family Rossman fold protein [Dehalococcoidia bacterium]
MQHEYEINELIKEDSWRMFRIIGEFVSGFDALSDVEPAVSIYGSARLKPNDELYKRTEEISERLGNMGFSIITGGGPGVMEAANKGAAKAGANSIGLNINLPEEQAGNTYTTRSLTFNHFFVRKVMLVKYASAFVIMPGGLGTLDELTEVLNLIQTYKIKPFPVILYDADFWQGFLDWMRRNSLANGYISESDLNLLRICKSPDEVTETILMWYSKGKLSGKQAITG